MELEYNNNKEARKKLRFRLERESWHHHEIKTFNKKRNIFSWKNFSKILLQALKGCGQLLLLNQGAHPFFAESNQKRLELYTQQSGPASWLR
jgi:hypothetical protein